MEEGRTRVLALLGTVALHVAVVWWLASSPERTAKILQVVEMEFVELTPPPPPPPPPTLPETQDEPELAPEPEPERVVKRRVNRRDRQSNQEPGSDDSPPAEQFSEIPTAGPPDQPPGPRVIDFSQQNFALSGSSTGFGMRVSQGGSRYGVYRPGSRGGGGGGGPTAGGGGASVSDSDFSPVPLSQLSRRAQLVGQLERRYPEEARRQQIEGTVRLMIEIRSSGQVRRVRLLGDPGGGLGQSAIEALRRARFRPALDRQGQPVDSRIVYTVRFVLDD